MENMKLFPQGLYVLSGFGAILLTLWERGFGLAGRYDMNGWTSRDIEKSTPNPSLWRAVLA